MKQADVTAWVADLNVGDSVGVFTGSKLLFESKVLRRTTTGMVVCEPGGTFKASGAIHGRLADQSRRLRPLQTELSAEECAG